jgi:uncharacterized membrane protein YphA (DoxX/SURF4 family)
MAELGYACAVVLAAVFVRAGAAKLARPAATSAGFATLGVPAAAGAAHIVPVVELLVAAGLLAVPRAGAIVALVLLAVFSGFLARALRAGTTAPCNCFGTARTDPVSPVDLMRNAMLAVLALAGLAATRPVVPGPLAVVVAGGGFALGCVALRAQRGRLRHR